MLKLVSLQLLHGVKVLRDWNIISVDESWTLRHMFENLADGTDGRDEGDSWMLDTALCGLPFVYKMGSSRKGDFQRILLSLTVDDAMRWNLVSTFGLSCKEAEKRVAWLSLQVDLLLYATLSLSYVVQQLISTFLK